MLCEHKKLSKYYEGKEIAIIGNGNIKTTCSECGQAFVFSGCYPVAYSEVHDPQNTILVERMEIVNDKNADNRI